MGKKSGSVSVLGCSRKQRKKSIAGYEVLIIYTYGREKGPKVQPAKIKI